MRFKPKPSDFIFMTLVIAVIVFLILLPSPRDNNPPVPADLAHRGIKLEKDCLVCHAPRGVRPVSARHPKRQDCFRCHRQGKPSV
jgi:hypothetical protein